MARLILLDAGVIGLACCSRSLPQVQPYWKWIDDLEATGASIGIPHVTYYKVRRELLRVRATAKLVRLEAIRARQNMILVDEKAWDQAAGFWAIGRQTGKPTAHSQALDADAILAGVAATLVRPGDSVMIATTTTWHLQRFLGVDAQQWDAIPERRAAVPRPQDSDLTTAPPVLV